MLPGLVNDALKQQPDLLYFSGYASDVNTLLKSLPACPATQDFPTQSVQDCPLVLGGEALYLQEDYALQTLENYYRLRFTVFTYPSKWLSQDGQQPPSFFSAYTQAFDPSGQYQPGTYGYNLPEGHTMLTYDAMSVLLHAAKQQLQARGAGFSPDDLAQSIRQIDTAHPLQGISWPIAFRTDGTDSNGNVVVLAAQKGGRVALVSDQT